MLEVSDEPQNQFSNRSFHSGPLVHRSQLPKSWKNEDDPPKLSAVADSAGLDGPFAARQTVVSDNGCEDLITHLGGPPACRLSESENECSDARKCDQTYGQREDQRSSNKDQPTVSIQSLDLNTTIGFSCMFIFTPMRVEFIYFM